MSETSSPALFIIQEAICPAGVNAAIVTGCLFKILILTEATLFSSSESSRLDNSVTSFIIYAASELEEYHIILSGLMSSSMVACMTISESMSAFISKFSITIEKLLSKRINSFH